MNKLLLYLNEIIIFKIIKIYKINVWNRTEFR